MIIMNQAIQIRKFLLQNIPRYPHDVVVKTMHHFNVSRTTVLRHLNYLIKNNEVLKTGQTKQATYSLTKSQHVNFCLPIHSELDEFIVFQKYLDTPLKKFVNDNTYKICEYGVTEMINNAKDHSSGSRLDVTMKINKDNVIFIIKDNGIGIFKNIIEKFNYPSYQDSILDLSKGKLTTDPKNHSGEGIFFTSRVFDRFSIAANGYCYFRDNSIDDWSFYSIKKEIGTTIHLTISCQSECKLISQFQKYQDANSLAFNKTEIKVELAKFHGERLISRSQAKRILRNLEQFNHVLLDFKNVVAVGQGFVDEIFRVYKIKNPTIQFDYCNANEDVEFMIKRSIPTDN